MQVAINITAILQFVTVAMMGVITFFAKRELKRLDNEDEKNEKNIKEAKKEMEEKYNKLKDEIEDFKSDIPYLFTLKEDFNRAIEVVRDSIDDIGKKVDKLLERRN